MNDIKELKEKMKNLKVLFADDEIEIREGMGSFLKKFFTNVVICRDGLEALEEFKKSKDFDIVMTDIKMPKMSGDELVSKIKELNPEIFTVFMTASRGSIPFEENAHALFLKKPLSFDEMIIILKTIGDTL